MKHTDETLANMIARRFRRWGHSGRSTGLVRDLADCETGIVESNVDLELGEEIVLIAVNSPDSWSALTTRRLICVCASGRLGIRWDSIANVDADPSVGNDMLREDFLTRISRLRITTTSGERVTVETEPGPPCVGFWNALRLAQQLSGRVGPKN